MLEGDRAESPGSDASVNEGLEWVKKETDKQTRFLFAQKFILGPDAERLQARIEELGGPEAAVDYVIQTPTYNEARKKVRETRKLLMQDLQKLAGSQENQ